MASTAGSPLLLPFPSSHQRGSITTGTPPATSLTLVPSSTAAATPGSTSTQDFSKRKRRLSDLTPEEINEIVALRGKMPQAVVGRKFGIEQTEVSAIQRMQRAKTARLLDDNEKKNPVRRMKDVELTFPIAYGTISFWLGKKADEYVSGIRKSLVDNRDEGFQDTEAVKLVLRLECRYHSHKWTVYLRSASNEDLGPLIKRVVFQLHPSFNNPTRTVESAPFELTETGWGEFEIGITVYFHPDAAEKPLEIFHHLKLYPEDESGPQNTKKPVVVESYDEVVFTEPSEAFFLRIRNYPIVTVNGQPTTAGISPPVASGGAEHEKKRGDTKDHPLVQWFLKQSDAEEVSVLTAARHQVQTHVNKLKRDLSALEMEALRLKSNAN